MKKYLLIAFLSLAVLHAPQASAITDNQRRLIQSGVYYYNEQESSEACSTGTSELIGSENGEKIYNFLVSKGLQPFQVGGIMGNLQAESGLNPKRVQSTPTPSGDKDNITVDNKTGYGLAQWTSSGRQQGLADLAAERGVISGDLGVQLDYLMKELEESYPAIYAKIKASTTLDSASDIFMVEFERPADQSESAREKRRAMGRALLAQYGGSTAATSSASGGTSCSAVLGGSVVGGFSLPLDRKWYDEHQNWFTKPHHDYPAADIPVPTGTPVYSMTAGKVISSHTVNSACGAGLTVEAASGITFIYCHGSDGGSVPGARVGDTVQPGQLIMHSANTGRSTGPHLHLGITVDGERRCPQTLFTGIVNGTPPDPRSLPKGGCTN